MSNETSTSPLDARTPGLQADRLQPGAPGQPVPVLDVVIPVYNEQAALAACVERVHEHLVAAFPYPFRITVADNASTDLTPQVAQRLTERFDAVRLVRLEEKGRGRALRQVWLGSDATVLAYMDVDLSTDLAALLPLVAPLMSGHSDLAIGSRLAAGSHVVRGAKREFISRSYNRILRVSLGVSYSDAQCGFKAIRRDVAQELLPLVEDNEWFFDTELLTLAQRSGLRIHEVPVDWYDDPDSRVDVVGTATDDLKGVWRLRRALSRGTLPVNEIRERMGRGAVALPGPDGDVVTQAGEGADLIRQVARFATIGVFSTVLHLGLFAALVRGGTGAQLSNLVALVIATVANTAANRAWTFGVHGRDKAVTHQGQGLLIFAITWVASAGALGLIGGVAGPLSTGMQTAAVAVANVLSTAARFVAMRSWIFRDKEAEEGVGEGRPGLTLAA